MLARFRTVWESVSTSLWFIPSLLIVAAALLAWLTITFRFDLAEDGPVWWLHSGSSEDAATLLSSLLTSMVTMATLVISITMVVLTLAAGHLGPRLIRMFMADKYTQLILGFFLATNVYLILVFRMVNEGAAEGGPPHVAVTLGTALVLVSVVLLLIFVHHLARSIIADTVIHRVGGDLDTAFARMLPELDEAAADAERLSPPLEDAAPFRLPAGGYVQAIDYAGLAECAREAGAVIALDFRPGQHLLAGGTHGHVCPASALQEAFRDKIPDYIVLGSQPTAAQDVEFAIRQLVEVAVRALSPGVNDPFTAIAAIDRLGRSLAFAMGRGAAQEVWRDEEGTARVGAKPTTFAGVLDAAFNQIRQAGGGHPAILIRIVTTLAQLSEHAGSERHRQAIATHVGLVEAEGERSIAEPYDLRALKEQSAAARAQLG
jgi:uncharacterized membrane protein